MSNFFIDELAKLDNHFFTNHGFVEAFQRDDPKSFGNSLLYLKNKSLVICFTRDRGQVFIDIAPAFRPTAQVDGFSLNELINPSRGPLGMTLDACVEFLESSYEKILCLMNPSKIDATLLQIKQNRDTSFQKADPEGFAHRQLLEKLREAGLR